MEKTYRTKRPPYGFNFLDTEATARLETRVREIQDILKAEGYLGVTPASIDFPETFESYENYSSFRFRDSQGEDLWLRSDATVQVIKAFTNLLERKSDKGESKFYYFSPVFRDVRRNYPSLREVYQVGVETIGLPSEKLAENLLLLAHRLLSRVFGLKYRLLMGDVKITRYLESRWPAIPLREIALNRDAPTLASALEKSGTDGLSKELARLLLYPPEYVKWKERLEEMASGNASDALKETVRGLLKISKAAGDLFEKLSAQGISLGWDPLLTRKVNYYTGFIFEGYVEDLPNAPLRGGAYDGLVAKYSDLDLPAGGFALDLSSLL